MTMFRGNTSQWQAVAKKLASEYSPYLPASWWRVGDALYFEIVAQGKNSNGHFIAAHLIGGFDMNFSEGMSLDRLDANGDALEPDPSPETVTVKMDGQQRPFSDVKIGNLAGITLARMAALELSKNKYFQIGDKVLLRCVGITPAEKEGYSDSPNFELSVDREER